MLVLLQSTADVELRRLRVTSALLTFARIQYHRYRESWSVLVFITILIFVSLQKQVHEVYMLTDSYRTCVHTHPEPVQYGDREYSVPTAVSRSLVTAAWLYCVSRVPLRRMFPRILR